MKLFSLTVALFPIATAAIAQATTDPSPQIGPPADSRPARPYIPILGANLGYEQVLSSSTRDTFGNKGLIFTPSFGPVFAKKGSMLMPGIRFLNLSQDVGTETNKALIVALGPSLRFGFANPFDVKQSDGKIVLVPRPFSPYAEFGVRLVYADLSAHAQGISDKRLTYGGCITLGTGFRKNLFIQARLTILPDIESYNFSSCAFEVGIRF